MQGLDEETNACGFSDIECNCKRDEKLHSSHCNDSSSRRIRRIGEGHVRLNMMGILPSSMNYIGPKHHSYRRIVSSRPPPLPVIYESESESASTVSESNGARDKDLGPDHSNRAQIDHQNYGTFDTSQTTQKCGLAREHKIALHQNKRQTPSSRRTRGRNESLRSLIVSQPCALRFRDKESESAVRYRTFLHYLLSDTFAYT
jgi:hypothetical protein